MNSKEVVVEIDGNRILLGIIHYSPIDLISFVLTAPSTKSSFWDVIGVLKNIFNSFFKDT